MKKSFSELMAGLLKKRKAERISPLETYLERKKRLWDEGLKYVHELFLQSVDR